MAILRKVKEQRYSIIDNDVLTDDSLSFRARGILAMYLSLPEGWQVSNAWLQKVTTGEGEVAIAHAVDELIAAGYYKRVKHQDSDGRWRTEVFVTEVPGHFDPKPYRPQDPVFDADEYDPADAKAQVSPSPGNRGVGELGAGNSGGKRERTSEKGLKRASHAERDDDRPRQATPVSPRRTPRQRPSGRRLAAAEENGPGDSRLIGVSTNTARASAERTRQQVVHQPTSAAGLAAEFDRRAREAGLHGPQQLNPGALSRNLRRWMDEGDTALAIQNMFDKFYDNATVHPADTPLWTHFIRVGPKLRAGTKDTSIDYAAAAERDRERLKRDAAAGDQRAIAVLDGSAYKWRQQS